ncbi:hypothetical protein L6452_39960 [Arctium lappa]|uniref:Uncharacterized protein n=1 Tax=Arctium lappa TaxID=4217 RepID=A0ACB8XT87_ARCLA|nr:hypothetical protein L6452_39960 [Arctium lappa]
MESILEFMRSLCFFGNNKKKKTQHKRKQQQRPSQKNDQPTLQDCILSSPAFNRSSPLPATSKKRVHPNDDVSMKRLLLEDEETVTEMKDDSSPRGRRKKRVSFRMPEVVDVFIILAASPTTHHSSDLQSL